MDKLKLAFFAVVITFALVFITLISKACSWVDKAAAVAEEQVDPRLLLQRYEWFKTALSQLDSKRASIEMYEKRTAQMEQDYIGIPRTDWDRSDKEQHSLWVQEYSGMVAGYNNLAAKYNAAMAKANFRFTNVGDLPQGSKDPLPREVVEYKLE